MQQSFRDQFENLRLIINTNIATLKSLLTQSKQLSELIETLNGKTEDNEFRAKLESLRDGMLVSIDTLIKQNQELFKTYDKLLDKIFSA